MPRYGINSPAKISERIEAHACIFEYPTLAQMQCRGSRSPTSDELSNVEGPLPIPNRKDRLLVLWLPGRHSYEDRGHFGWDAENIGSEVDIGTEAARTKMHSCSW